MRIIAGSLGGRQFASPTGHRTHPMSEKVRGAIFNALGDIDGLTIFDPFAGSGAVGFEAISRGASSATLLDIDKNAFECMKSNIHELASEDRVKAVRVNAASWLETQPDKLFDVVVLDPPYDDIKLALLQKLADRARPGGIVVLSLPPNDHVELPSSFTLLSSKSYGDATLWFYRAAAATD
ncbi:RsmD family RNA methyltransferase [Candidatus Saccharibacteria bacterium]|nr:RsmD family RNA methyltransferase [Candidatus Saccharibacteria bacterium]